MSVRTHRTPSGVEAVDGLVEDEGLRVAEQRGGDAQPLTHPEGEPADALAADALEAGHLDHLLHPPPAEAVRGGHGPQVVRRRPSGVDGLRLEQGTHLGERGPVSGVGTPVDGDCAPRGPVQADDHAHGGRFPGAVRAEEAGDLAGPDGEGDVVDGLLRSVGLGEVLSGDHDDS
jgi:hypothetical protein